MFNRNKCDCRTEYSVINEYKEEQRIKFKDRYELYADVELTMMSGNVIDQKITLVGDSYKCVRNMLAECTTQVYTYQDGLILNDTKYLFHAIERIKVDNVLVIVKDKAE